VSTATGARSSRKLTSKSETSRPIDGERLMSICTRFQGVGVAKRRAADGIDHRQFLTRSLDAVPGSKPQPGDHDAMVILAPFVPQREQRADMRSRSLDASLPHRIT
jgi:hypothetical protein